MRALVIDDSRTIRLILSRLLGEVGFEVSQAENGKVALELLRGELEVELALVDWNMPEMNGLEFIRSVRADPHFDETKLIMVTTESEIAQIELALDAGVDEYVVKPFTKEVILEKIQMLGVKPA